MARSIGKVQEVRKVWLSKDEAQVSFSRFGKMIWYDINSIDRFLNRNKVV